MRHPNEKIERSLFKIVAWALGIIILLVAGGVLGHRSFRNWQERRLIAQANALVNEGDFKRASLDARRVLQINPESAAACRVMARIAERAGLRAAVDWRRQVVERGAATPADFIALARVAIRFEEKAAAEFALSRIPKGGENTAEYHALEADLALGRRDGMAMERHLSEAVRLEPSNKDYVIRLASLRLGANDPAVQARGRQTLIEFQNDPATRRDATRNLVEEALRRGASSSAVQQARRLDSFSEKTFSDRLLLLSSLQAACDPGFSAFLEELQSAAAESPEDVADLLSWMNVHRMHKEAVAWGTGLPPATTSQKRVPLARSDAYLATADWAGIERLVKNANWGKLDFVRHALHARALRELGKQPDSAAQWNEAVKKAGDNPKQLLVLAEIIQKWGWRGEAIDLLWLVTKDPAMGDQALQTLYQYFVKNGDTRDIYRVLLRRLEFHPHEHGIQNRVAQLSLLLNLNVERGQKTARELYEKEPANAAYVSTYAFALYTQGDAKKAVKTMSRLSAEQLRQPAVAAYFGIVLAAAGDRERAAEFLALGDQPSLLPEEKTLVEKARRSLASI